MSFESWVPSANTQGADFPIQNLAYGVFESASGGRVGIAIGDYILDLRACAEAGLLAPETAAACASDSLNVLMALDPRHWSALRGRVTELLVENSPHRKQVEPWLTPMSGAVMRLPAAIGDYTDFFAAIHHATNAGSMFRAGDPLFPNYKYVPVGYHGRASSIVVSGTPVRRPSGQTEDKSSGQPHFGPSGALEYELEIGVFVGPGNRLGEPISIGDAPSRIFGLCLLNDWSARDMQAWESQPLGPFLSKSLATSISPWVVPMEALEPFREPAFPRPASDPAPLPYLYSAADQARGGIAITVEAYLASQQMRENGVAPLRLSRGNFRDLYWTIAQLLAHHASNGCNLRPGDLFGSGTVSGPARDSWGCLLELTRRGQEPFRLPTGEERRFLEDGDEVTFRAYCEREGYVRIGFGECRGMVVPATLSRP